jgi:5,10-methylenetetrahydrofolate reductase
MLRAAVELRERGLIPRNVELWGVANPLTEKPERAAVAKAEAGADAILTQPPLSQRAWLRWWEGVQRISRSSSPSSSSGSSVPPIVGGLALPNSPGALRFWITLCGAGNVEGVEEEVAAFAAAAASSSSGAAASPSSAKQREHALSYCRKTLSFYESLGDELAGIHVMPVTAPGREIARQLLEEGALARWDWRREE